MWWRRRVTKVALIGTLIGPESSILFNMHRIPAIHAGGIETHTLQAFSFHDPLTTTEPRGCRAKCDRRHALSRMVRGPWSSQADACRAYRADAFRQGRERPATGGKADGQGPEEPAVVPDRHRAPAPEPGNGHGRPPRTARGSTERPFLAPSNTVLPSTIVENPRQPRGAQPEPLRLPCSHVQP